MIYDAIYSLHVLTEKLVLFKKWSEGFIISLIYLVITKVRNELKRPKTI